RRAREVLGALEHELHNLEPAVLPVREQLLEEHCLVVAIRAPTAADRDEHDLAVVALIRKRVHLAVDVREAEYQPIEARLERSRIGLDVELCARVAAAREGVVRAA